MPIRGIEAMGDDPGRSELGEEEEDFGSEDDDVITPLQDRLSWKSFFGSSVDLAPTLMTIYDNYSASINSTPPDALALSADQSCAQQLRHHLAKSCSDIHYENVQAVRCKTESAMENLTETRTETTRVSSTELNGDVPSALVNLVLPNDAKKRPLSISSTSSSNSSTSSLPRHQRKKVATTSCLATATTTCLATATTTCVTTTRSGQSTLYGTGAPMDTSAGLIAAPPSDSGNVPRRTSPSNSCDIVDKDVRKVKFTSASGRNVYIDRVVTEILDSERSYVRDLNDIIQGYVRHILETPELSIPEEDVVALFGNIEAIYHFSRGFLECLEQCGHDAVSIASCFVDMTDGFDIYTQYCTNYPRSVVVLTQCVNDTQLAVMFKQRQGMLGHGLPLGAYLLKPIQRVLKYHLLLQKIVNNYDENAAGYDMISNALSSMTHMAAHINEMKRKHEHTMRVQEIQSLLHDWDGHDLITYGDLILEDSFRMSGAKVSRQLFLFEKGLLVTKKREDGHLLVKAAIESSNLMLIESVPKEPLSFHVIPFNNPRVQYTIQARSLEQKRKWCREIKRLILENFQSVIPEKVKELVMKLGKSREEEDLDESCEIREQAPRQHSAPEYLEKRRAGRRKSTSMILDFGLLKSRLAARRSPPVRRRSDITPPNFASPIKSRLMDTAGTGGILEEQDSLQSIDDSSTECSGVDTNTSTDTPRNHSNNSLTLEADSEDSASEIETVSPIWRRESLKKATEPINRIDSQMKPRHRRNATVQRPEQFISGDVSRTRVEGDCEHSSNSSQKGTHSSREGGHISSSPTFDNDEGGCDRNEHKTTSSSSPLRGGAGETSISHVLATSCSSPVLLSRSSHQGSDPWVPMTEPLYCQQYRAERARSPCRSPCRSSVSPSRDFGSGLLFCANSCTSLSDCIESAALYGKCSCSAVISVLGSPRVSRINMDVLPQNSTGVERQETRKQTDQGGSLTPQTTPSKTDTTPESDRELCGFCMDNSKGALNGVPPVHCTCSERKSGAIGTESSPQGEGYIPKYVTSNMKRFSTDRSSSFSDATQHAVISPVSPSLSSPCSTTSTDSLVDSLRNAVGNLRSRLTRRQAAAHSHIKRARSASAIDRISQQSPPRETKEKERRRQNKLVHQLKRTYSERERKKNRFGGSAIIIPATDRKRVDTSNELMSLLKETTLGSPAIGARFATARPCSLTNHTLPRRMQPDFSYLADKISTSNDGDTEASITHTSQPTPDVTAVATRAMNNTKDGRRLAYDSGCVDTDILCSSQKDICGDAPEVTIDDFSDETFKQLEIGSRNILDSVDTVSNAPSLESYYERRFAEELEMDATSHHSDEAVFRDSAVYSDDGILLCAGDTIIIDTGDTPFNDSSANKDNGTTQCVNDSATDDDKDATLKDSADCVGNNETEHDNRTSLVSASLNVNGSTTDAGNVAQSKPPVLSDAVKSIHEKYNSVSTSQAKTRQKLIQKAPAFQEIVRSMEDSNSTEQSKSPSPDVDACMSPFKTSTPSVSRELVHCASLTRMRQDSASISDKHFTEEWPPRQRIKSQDSDASLTPVDDTATSPVLLESITKAPLSPMSPTQFPWSPTPLAKKKVGWPWSPTPMPKVTSHDGPGSDRAKVVRSPSPQSKDRTPMLQSPESQLEKEPQSTMSLDKDQRPATTEPQSPVPCKATLTVNIHKAASTPEDATTCGQLHAEWPPGDSPGSDEQPKMPMSPARRGWVRFMVKQLQGDEPAS